MPSSQVLDLYLPSALFTQLSNDYNLPTVPDRSIRYEGGLQDEVINQIGRSVLSEMMSPTAAGRMLVETSSLLLAARLVHSHLDSGPVRLPIESVLRRQSQKKLEPRTAPDAPSIVSSSDSMT